MLNGWSQFYRQTLLFGSFPTAEANALFSKYCYSIHNLFKDEKGRREGREGREGEGREGGRKRGERGGKEDFFVCCFLTVSARLCWEDACE